MILLPGHDIAAINPHAMQRIHVFAFNMISPQQNSSSIFDCCLCQCITDQLLDNIQFVCLCNADGAKEEALIRRGCTASRGAQEENQSKEPGMLV